MSTLEHIRRVGSREKVCEPNCPACAEGQKRAQLLIDRAQTVLNMWLAAIHAGERTIEKALRDVDATLAKLSRSDADRMLAEFVRQALAAKPHLKKRRGPPRTLPTAFIKANRLLVDSLAVEKDLPKTNVDDAGDDETVFACAANLWREFGLDLDAIGVQRAYYRYVPPAEVGVQKI